MLGRKEMSEGVLNYMKCNCCGREVNDAQCKRSIRVSVESRGMADYFHANLLCNICYEEILITLGAYLEDDID